MPFVSLQPHENQFINQVGTDENWYHSEKTKELLAGPFSKKEAEKIVNKITQILHEEGSPFKSGYFLKAPPPKGSKDPVYYAGILRSSIPKSEAPRPASQLMLTSTTYTPGSPPAKPAITPKSPQVIDLPLNTHPTTQLNQRPVSKKKMEASLIKNYAEAQKQVNVSENTKWEKDAAKYNVITLSGNDLDVSGLDIGISQLGRHAAPSSLVEQVSKLMEDTKTEDSFKFQIIEVGGGNFKFKIPLFGVFDGHCAEEGGKQCSEYATNLPKFFKEKLQAVISQYPKEKLSRQLDSFVYNALKLAFEKVHRKILEDLKTKDSGTTATVTVIFNGAIWTAAAGDSGAFVSTSKDPISLTVDQKPKQEATNVLNRGSQIINDPMTRQPRCYPDGLGTTRSLGHPTINPRPVIVHVPLKDLPTEGRNFLVMGSDGLTDQASMEQISATVQEWSKQGLSCPEISKELTLKARHVQGKHRDDITVLVVELPSQQSL